MSLKDRISSPLEAGTSILDAHHLPPHLAPALEYASGRLARKSMHVTLVVARRDYQLPSVVPPIGSPGLSTPTTPISPAMRFGFSSKPVAALKQLVRYTGPTPARSLEAQRSPMAASRFPRMTVDTSSPKLRWPLSPTTPLSPPPMTPCTASSTSTTETMGSMMSSATFGMRLIHATGLPAKTERCLRATLQKAERKFGVGTEWLSPSVSPATCGLTSQLVHGSIVQNEVLFASEGLTLLSLDRLYNLKSALSSYSKTRSHLRLEDAVDELRRIILANNGAKVTRSDILRSYDWLSVSNSALADLDRMYRRAYGGPDELGAISGMSSFAEPAIKCFSEFLEDSDDEEEDEGDTVEVAVISRQSSLPPTPPPKAPSPKGPVLKLQTSFELSPMKAGVGIKAEEGNLEGGREEEDDGELTARPTDQVPFMMIHPWQAPSTIDQVLSPIIFSPNLFSPSLLSPDQASTKYGPLTPNDYDDISPTTRGEWGFLMVDQGARTVAVETC
ncbi:hypothetical protein G7046_g3826 [Stylonectria norvegica]|nr:hypothetical protein G7046_g3826 [Stylonectria norvegica]